MRPSEGKGNGSFASKPIALGTYIGDYEGELLDEASYWQRYPSGVVRFPSCYMIIPINLLPVNLVNSYWIDLKEISFQSSIPNNLGDPEIF